jgi:hypothetical protein
MIALMTKTDSGWEHDKFLAQPTTGLLEQQLVTTYRDLDGAICQKIVSRKFFNEKDYVDSTTNKILG